MGTPFFVCSGPALFWVQLPTFRAVPQFFGTSVGTPVIEKRPLWQPVYANTEAAAAPFDMQFHGSSAVVSATFNKWDNNLYYLLSSAPRQRAITRSSPFGFAALPQGRYTRYEIGALAIHDAMFAQLLVLYPYAEKPHSIVQGMLYGYRFPYAFLATDGETPGSQVQSLSLAWACNQVVPVQFDQPPALPAGYQSFVNRATWLDPDGNSLNPFS